MVQTITPQNIDEVLQSVMGLLDQAEIELGCPGCSTDEMGILRCEALNGVKDAKEIVRNVIHKTYLYK